MTNTQNIQKPDSKSTNLNSKFLGGLPKADQDRILDMLDHRSYRDVLQEINQPAPEGLGLKIHCKSLRRFYFKHLPSRLAEARPDAVADWKLLAEQAARDPIDFQDLIRESLEREVYLAFLHSEPTNSRPIKLMQCLLRWRSQDLRQAKSSKRSTKQAAPSSDLAKIVASEKITAANSSTPASFAASPSPVPASPATLTNTKTAVVPKPELVPIRSPASATILATANPSKLRTPPATPATPAPITSASTKSEPSVFTPAPLAEHVLGGKSSTGVPIISGTSSAPESFQPINLEILKKAISMVNAKYGIPGHDVPSQPFPLPLSATGQPVPDLGVGRPHLRTPDLPEAKVGGRMTNDEQP